MGDDTRPDPGFTATRRRWLTAAGWALLVAVLLLVPGRAIPSPPWWLPSSLSGWIDSLVHGVLFFLLMLLLRRAASESTSNLLISALALSYALILEVLQIPVPGRSFQVVDLVFAAAGVGCSLLVARRLSWLR